MPTSQEAARGGALRYRTITTGTGRNKRYLRIAVVPKRGKRGGHTVAGKPQTYKKAGK